MCVTRKISSNFSICWRCHAFIKDIRERALLNAQWKNAAFNEIFRENFFKFAMKMWQKSGNLNQSTIIIYCKNSMGCKHSNNWIFYRLYRIQMIFSHIFRIHFSWQNRMKEKSCIENIHSRIASLALIAFQL